MMFRLLPLFVALILFVAGCSSEPYKIAPVSGVVTVDGKPVPKAAVMFQPIATEGHLNPGPGSFGITDSEGRYTLELVGKKTRGVVVGKHKVRIENYNEPGDPTDDRPRPRVKAAIPIPPKYNVLDPKLQIEFEVPSGGTDKADFALTTK
jgi:hypothetical protein